MTLPRRLRPTPEQRLRTLTTGALPGLAQGLSRSLRPVRQSGNKGVVLPDTPATAVTLAQICFEDNTLPATITETIYTCGFNSPFVSFGDDLSADFKDQPGVGNLAMLTPGIYQAAGLAQVDSLTAGDVCDLGIDYIGQSGRVMASFVVPSGGEASGQALLSVSTPPFQITADNVNSSFGPPTIAMAVSTPGSGTLTYTLLTVTRLG